MRWQRVTTYAALLLAVAALAAWQYNEYGRERYLARQTLRGQADLILNVLVGGIQSHRRLGRFVQEHFQVLLDELVKSEDVLAVAVAREDGQPILSAGKTELLDRAQATVAGESWDADGLRLVRPFRLSPDPFRPPRGDPGEMGPPRGGLLQTPLRGGRGFGRKAGWRGAPPRRPEEIGPGGLFAAGGRFTAILVFDRSQTDAYCRHAARMRASRVAAVAGVLLCIAWAWRASVRAAEAHGRARLLETETRHLRDLSQAAAGLAHETRNPLGLVRGWTQRLAQSGLESPGHQQQAQAVVEECDRVSARINQFLAFARPCDPRPESVRVSELVGELAALLGPDLDAKNLTLEGQSAAGSGTIRADRELLRQALFNLLQNAVQSSPEGAAVELAVGRGQDGRRRIEVADQGPGVSAEAVESLFTPYFTTRSDGTGLGLAIVRRIAVAHGWQAGYTPRPGGGSIFWLDGMDG